MRQTATIQSPTRTPSGNSSIAMDKSALHPVLQAALASLDIQIETELTRYRRRRLSGKTGYFSDRSAATGRGVELMPTGGDRAPTAPVMPPMPGGDSADHPASPSPFHPTDALPPLAAIAPSSPTVDSPSAAELRQLAQQYAADVVATADQQAAGNPAPDDYLESSEALLRTLSQEEAEVQAEQGFLQSLLTPLGMGSMLLLLMSSALFGFVLMNPDSITQLWAQHRQSGSAVKSPAASGEPGAIAPSPGTASVTTPHLNVTQQEFPELQLGNLSAIDLNTATTVPSLSLAPKGGTLSLPQQTPSGLTVVSPANSVPKLPPTASPAPGRTTTPAGDVPSSRNLAAPAAPRPAAPRPAAPQYTPPAPEPVARQRYSPPARSYEPAPPARTAPAPRPVRPAPTPVQPYTPPATSLPAPKPSAVPPAVPPASVPSPAGSSGYKVVAPYTSDRSLEEYRRQMPDAYLQNYSDGAKVQFGAYQDEGSAKAQADELRKQGIPAEVYQP